MNAVSTRHAAKASPGEASASTGTDEPPLDARERYRLVQDCRDLLLDRLTGIVSEALEQMTAALTKEAVALGKSDRMRTLLDALTLVRTQRSAIERNFRRSFGDGFERLMFARADGSAPQSQIVLGDDLQLISEEAISQKVDIDRLIHKARSRLDPNEVLGIRARLGALVERDWFDESKHPASPEAIFEALRTALSEIDVDTDLDPGVRGALLNAFEPHVTRNLNGIYNVVNTRLKSHRVLPSIRQRLQRPTNQTLRQQGGPASGLAGVGEPGQLDGEEATVTMRVSSLAALQQVLARGATSNLAELRGDVARMLSDPGFFGIADLPLDPVEPGLVESLTQVQHEATVQRNEALSGERPIDNTLLMADLLPRLIEKARGKGTPLDQMTVELVSVVFDYIYADRSLAENVKNQLMRLQVVAVKAALLDRSFFARRQHPMRQMVERVTQMAADPDVDLSAESPLVKGLANVVDQLIDGFDQDLSIFRLAIERIELLHQAQTQRRAEALAEQLAAAERAEAFALALDTARRELADRIGETTPAFAREFLLRWWTPVMAQARTAPIDGDTGRGDQAREAAELLIWSLAAKRPEEIGQLAGRLPGLIQTLRAGSEAAEMPPPEQDAFFREMLLTHGAVIDQAKRSRQGSSAPHPSSMTLQPSGSVTFPNRPVEQPADLTTIPAGVSVLSAFTKGDRIELIDDAGGAAVYKLAWISPARKLFILSRYPGDALSLNAADLAARVFSERARRVEDLQAVEDAIGSLTREAAGLGRQAQATATARRLQDAT